MLESYVIGTKIGLIDYVVSFGSGKKMDLVDRMRIAILKSYRKK